MTNQARQGRLAAMLGIVLAGTTASAADVRGSLQGIDTLTPTPPADVSGRRLFYWEEPNGAIDVRRSRALPDMDLAVVLTGDGVHESTQPVPMPVVGGRCRPGTAVVTANGVLRVQNQDWFPHEFFATASGQTAPIAAFQAEPTAPRSERQVQIPEAGVYEIHDRLSPTFRCFVLVGPGQGRVVTTATDGAFRISPLTDGNYTLRVYFEGRQLAETTTTIAHDHDVTVPPINLAAPAAGANGAAAAGATPPAPGTAPANGAAAPAAPAEPPADTRRHRRGH